MPDGTQLSPNLKTILEPLGFYRVNAKTISDL
jgi:hypothetical protein